MILPGLDTLELWVNVYTIALSIAGVLVSTVRFRRLWKTRDLRKVWGIKDRDKVLLVCSELDEPLVRQFVEDREFIYSLKYGDVDAFFEVVVTLLRLYPNIKLRVMSSGEAESTRVDLARHIILIGGPDYNSLTARLLEQGITRFTYRSPHWGVVSDTWPNEIVVRDQTTDEELCHGNSDADIGYFERIRNPHHRKSNVILIGGCHTIGVTGAVKAFSMAESEEGETPEAVLGNARLVARTAGRGPFALIVHAERMGQTITVPVLKREDVRLPVEKDGWWNRLTSAVRRLSRTGDRTRGVLERSK